MAGEWSECEITSVTTWPPPLPARLVAATAVVAEAGIPSPVKSLSSQVMKMTEFPVQARETMISQTVLCRNASPVAIRRLHLREVARIGRRRRASVHVVALVRADPDVIGHGVDGQVGNELAESRRCSPSAPG